MPEEHSGKGESINFGESGMAAFFDRPLNTGARAALTFCLPGDYMPCTAIAPVLRNDGRRAELKFASVTQVTREKIRRYIDNSRGGDADRQPIK